MYNPAPFASSDPDELSAFVVAHPLGLLVSVGSEGLQASHAPMLFDPERKILRCHLARANGQLQGLEGSPVLVVFAGPDHYVSPAWYPSKQEHGKVVPTWNYSAVHMNGTANCFEGEDLRAFLQELTERHEKSIGSGWRISDAPADYIRNLATAIVGVEIVVSAVEGKWKLSQNRPAADQLGVVAALESLGSDLAGAVARDMRERQR